MLCLSLALLFSATTQIEGFWSATAKPSRIIQLSNHMPIIIYRRQVRLFAAPLILTDKSTIFSSAELVAVPPISPNTALDHFLFTCSSFADSSSIQFISRGAKLPKNIVSINSLVFVAANGPLLVILAASDRVDGSKLKMFLNTTALVDLAPSDQVETICGFDPRAVPPFGHFPRSLPTYIDQGLIESVQANPETQLLAGGGHPYWQCLLSIEALLQMDHVQTADLAMDLNVNGDTGEDVQQDQRASTSILDGLELAMPKPFFPVAPPPTSIAKLVLQQRDLSNPLEPAFVTVVGRVGKVRHMTKRLAFVELFPTKSPLGSGENQQQEGGDDERPWRSGLDGTEMSVQLIVGKPFCQRLGNIHGEAALAALKEGQLILVEANTNVGNRESLGNWVEKREMDLVVIDYHVLDGSSDKTMSSLGFVDTKPHKHTPPPYSVASQLDLPVLHLADIFSNETTASSPTLVVDDTDSVEAFAQEYSRIHSFRDTEKHTHTTGESSNSSSSAAAAFVGLDCEWLPHSLMSSPDEPQPVLLLQISLHPLKKVFVLDLMTLLRPLMPASEPMNDLEAAVSVIIGDLFSSKRLLKVGYQLSSDLLRLAASYPHIPSFQEVNAVLEVSTLIKRVLQMTKQKQSRTIMMSLARITSHYLGKTLDKSNQVSDWSARPLSQKQIEYASLDAAISPILAEKAMETVYAHVNIVKPRLERWEGDDSLKKALVSWRFLLLETDHPEAIRKLHATSLVGRSWIVSQDWITGIEPPQLPSLPSNNGEGPYANLEGVLRIPSRMLSIRETDDMELCASLVGQRAGRSKDCCLGLFLTSEVALPEGARIDYLQRSDYVEFQDGVALFVDMSESNVEGLGRPQSCPNKWLNHGHGLTWFLKSNEWREGMTDLAKKLISSTRDAAIPFVLLFVRMDDGHFLFCGRCRATIPEAAEKNSDRGRLVQLNLELLDYDALTFSEEFIELVSVD
jgi:prolyl-tRNA editing enzyme YbaK/EbsC (Cys-tRNA(Pro) deacylase)